MLREYIISEAMYALVSLPPAACCCNHGEKVLRREVQPGAVLTRIASSHIRVGTFQYAARWGTIDDLRALADYTLERHFFVNCDSDDSGNDCDQGGKEIKVIKAMRMLRRTLITARIMEINIFTC
jgi:uncharacterized protein YdiU (UPF0061 family)